MHVLLTRMQNDSREAAQKIRAAGHRVSLVPVLEIQPLDTEARQVRLKAILSQGKPNAVICISRNAVHWGLPILLESWPEAAAAPWFAVGSGTAEALAALGVTADIPVESVRSETFLELPALQGIEGQRFLYIAGENGRPLIETELGARGAQVLRWDVYRRRPDQSAVGQLAELDGKPDVLTAMSADSLLALDQALSQESVQEWRSQLLLVPSARVGDLARHLGYLQVQVVAVGGKDWPADYLRQPVL